MKRTDLHLVLKKGVAAILAAAMTVSVIMAYDNAGQFLGSIKSVFADEVKAEDTTPAESEAPKAEPKATEPKETKAPEATKQVETEAKEEPTETTAETTAATEPENTEESTEATETTETTGEATEPTESNNEATEPTETEKATEPTETEKATEPTETEPSETKTVETEPSKTDIELKERKIKAEGVDIYVSGLLPADVKVTAERVEVKVSGAKVIAAYDIKVFDKDGNEWQPAEPLKIEVASDECNSVTKNETKVIYVPDELAESGKPVDIKNKKIEKIDADVKDGKVEFEAGHFSVYVIIEHEGEDVVTPRVMFHFLEQYSGEALHNGSDAYYAVDPYEFTNMNNEVQTSQILKDGESAELIKDPENTTDMYFYGWYVVEPYKLSGVTDDYGIGTNDNKFYYKWPAGLSRFTFERPVSISLTDSGKASWSLNGVSGEGELDSDGNVHVFLAPLFKNYHFVNFMLLPRGSNAGSKNLMTRKLIALGESSKAEVKISDIRSSSNDPIHLIFTGWEYEDQNGDWVTNQTVDYSGATVSTPGKDGVYLNIDFTGRESVDLYPLFVEARWVDFFAGNSGSGASYVASGFLQAWGRATESSPLPIVHGQTVFSSLPQSSRDGYTFDGWYAFANTDPDTGEITNLNTPQDVTVKYLSLSADKYVVNTVTVNTTAVQIADGNGVISNTGMWSVTDNGDGTGVLNNNDTGYRLFETFGTADASYLRFYDGLDRLSLSAKWESSNTRITVIYWTEKARDIGYSQPAGYEAKDDYKASAVKVIESQLLSLLSGSVLTLGDLENYTEDSISILAPSYLEDIQAVPSGEEIYYDLNRTLSDDSVTVTGDGTTIFNVFYERKTFTLVFHLGHDGYISTSGEQTAANNGSWLQMFYNDSITTGYDEAEGGVNSQNRGVSTVATATMTYKAGTSSEKTYDNSYSIDGTNLKNYYLPDPDSIENDRNVYTITAKYGEYIGDRWPTPTNPDFTFSLSGQNKEMYTWSAYYGSRFAKLANDRKGSGQNWHPDINGVYSYMSSELCSDRDGTALINSNQVHHFVAYFGERNKAGIRKHYHILYEAVSGTYDPDGISEFIQGSDLKSYLRTTWTINVANAEPSVLDGKSFYEVAAYDAISNLPPESQLASDIAGYRQIYSCYNTPAANEHHIYFLYSPKQYILSFNMGTSTLNDMYYYNQILADADKYTGQVVVPEGYYFAGWYTNNEGIGDTFDFGSEKMPAQNLVLYPVIRVLQYTIKIDPNGGVLDHRSNSSVSTYFTANYGTPVGEYSVERDYIKLNYKELDQNDPNYYSGQKYYYINTQRLGIPSEGAWGLPSELRNAVYVNENDLEDYYNWYSAQINEADLSYWTGISALSYEDFTAAYVSGPYRPLKGETYTFMGWYQVYDDGTTASMPYNFNDPVTGSLELKALWRLDGGYFIQYNPYYFSDDGAGNITAIVGEIDVWTDPASPTLQLYADQTPTHILRAPVNVTGGWVFRGWRVVRADGERSFTDSGGVHTYTNWVPFGDEIYYQPGDDFIVDSQLVSDVSEAGKVIHMQAYYEKADDTFRRPAVTNLVLDANSAYGGYVNAGAGTLPVLSFPGRVYINTDDNLDGSSRPTQILFGDIQSNIAVHMYRYVTSATYNGQTGTAFFVNNDGYFLLGFDKNSDPSNCGYIPGFAPDSVVAVTRNEAKTLYAIWEPMVYVTFVNTTGSDLKLVLSGTGNNTIHVINEVTGLFDREKATTEITVPAQSGDVPGRVKIVLPFAEAGTDTITAAALNNHVNYKLSVAGAFGANDNYGEASSGVLYGNEAFYSGVLQNDATGLVVTYTEEVEPSVVFNVNGGEWMETSDIFVPASTNGIYSIMPAAVAANNNNYKPSDPSRTADRKIFIGWTTNEDIAMHTDFSSETAVTWGSTTVTPDAGSNVLEKIRSGGYLWDFSQEPPYGEILYAVWSDTVKVTFDLVKSGNNIYTWTGPDTTNEDTDYAFYRENATSRFVYYTLAKGEVVQKPYDPTNNNWAFLRWVTDQSHINSTTNLSAISSVIFDFESRVNSDITLFTSWMGKQSIRKYMFTVKNEMISGNPGEEFEYEITAASNMNSSGSYYFSDPTFLPVTTKLKNNETYTIEITSVSYYSGWWHNSLYITVRDKDNNIVTEGHLIEYHKGSTIEIETSAYQVILTVTQKPVSGYETEVILQDGSVVHEGEQTYALYEGRTGITNTKNISTAKDSFTFRSTRINNGSTEQNTFVGTRENYQLDPDSSCPDISETVIFRNEGTVSYPAPTGVISQNIPLAILILSGIMLGIAAATGRFRKNNGTSHSEISAVKGFVIKLLFKFIDRAACLHGVEANNTLYMKGGQEIRINDE
ncbi:MAG: InlB B-repeat-containing protein [Saccharofermentans sp.]|nr:InlB B-repeat-containing protein [Saccharofermentans sp.]